MKELLEKQLDLYRTLLRTKRFPPDSLLREEVIEFIEKFPRPLTEPEQREIRTLIEKAFTPLPISTGTEALQTFDVLIPKRGWFRSYYEYTLLSEPPTVFHFGCSLTLLGAALKRSVFFDKGYYKVYPNVATVLIAPTGKCRKTSATNVALGLAREVGVNVLSERVTPEALVTALGGQENATGLLYAPELAVFLGRQKYLEGMVPLLTSLFDAPDTWSSTTIARGKLKLANVALSLLGASTLEWFIEALPHAAFTGGFMARLLFIVQEETPRKFALPKRPEGHLWEKLREDLLELVGVKGEVVLDSSAHAWYEEWYSDHHKRELTDEKSAGYHERKPDHLLRLAFLLRLASAQSLQVMVQDFELALSMLDWMESSLPRVFTSVAATSTGATHQRILRLLENAGGKMNHSVLLRRNQHIMNAREFSIAIDTLKQSGCIIEVRTRSEHHYELVRDGGG